MSNDPYNRTNPRTRTPASQSRRPARGASAPPPRRPGSRGRRVNKVRVAVVCGLSVLLIAGIVVLIALLIGPSEQAATSGKKAVFGVSEITIEGLTKYAAADIIEESGIYVGQSVLTVNKKKAAQNIISQFHYIQSIVVDSPKFGHIRITVQEETPLAVVKSDAGWYVVALSGKAVERMTEEQALASGHLRVVVAAFEENAAEGEILLPKKTFDNVQALLNAFELYSLEGIEEIDLSDTLDIRMNYKGRIEILLGSDTNLADRIRLVQSVLIRILDKHGEDAKGRLNMSSFSDSSNTNPAAVFTPADTE